VAEDDAQVAGPAGVAAQDREGAAAATAAATAGGGLQGLQVEKDHGRCSVSTGFYGSGLCGTRGLVAEHDAQVAGRAGLAAQDREGAAAATAVAAAAGGLQGLQVEKDHGIASLLMGTDIGMNQVA